MEHELSLERKVDLRLGIRGSANQRNNTGQRKTVGALSVDEFHC